MKKNIDKDRQELILILISCIAVYFIVWAYSGSWPWSANPYNSYVLQAKAWLSGHADLGRDYSHLEIASYNGKYFVSFPPVPSVILLPFTAMGISDQIVSLATSLTMVVFVWKLCKKCEIKHSSYWTLFLVIGSNVLLVCVNAWVWFFAQNLSLMFMFMSIYYATDKKGVLSLTFWALAVGCRPFQIVYLPLLLIILIQKNEKFKFKDILKWLIAPTLIAVLYMFYNYIRFNSVWEFGHNYLPEFLESKNGQFNVSYISENLKSLLRLPKINANGGLVFPEFNGMSIFLCFPIIIFCLVYSLQKIKKPIVQVGLLLTVIHILFLTAHKTMGGYHFGNRYFIDTLPCLFYIMLVCMPEKENFPGICKIPLFLLGLGLNLTGIIQMLMKT